MIMIGWGGVDWGVVWVGWGGGWGGGGSGVEWCIDNRANTE